MSEEALKPCPFCGSNPGTQYKGQDAIVKYGDSVGCENIHCHLRYHWIEKHQWNRRIEHSTVVALRAQVVALREAAEKYIPVVNRLNSLRPDIHGPLRHLLAWQEVFEKETELRAVLAATDNGEG